MNVPSGFTLTSTLTPVGISYDTLVGSEIITPSIKKLFETYEQLYATLREMGDSNPIGEIANISDRDVVDVTLPARIQKCFLFCRNIEIFQTEKTFETEKIKRLLANFRGMYEQTFRKKQTCELEKKKLVKAMTEELEKCGQSSFSLKCHNTIEVIDKTISIILLDREAVKAKIFVYEKQLELISNQRKMELVPEDVFKTIPKRIPLKVMGAHITRDVLVVTVEPPEKLCQYVLVGPIRPNSHEGFLELCAIPGKSLQSPRVLEFELDQELWMECGYKNSMKFVALDDKGELKEFNK